MTEELTEEMIRDLIQIAGRVSGRVLMDPEFKMPDGTILVVDRQGMTVPEVAADFKEISGKK